MRGISACGKQVSPLMGHGSYDSRIEQWDLVRLWWWGKFCCDSVLCLHCHDKLNAYWIKRWRLQMKLVVNTEDQLWDENRVFLFNWIQWESSSGVISEKWPQFLKLRQEPLKNMNGRSLIIGWNCSRRFVCLYLTDEARGAIRGLYWVRMILNRAIISTSRLSYGYIRNEKKNLWPSLTEKEPLTAKPWNAEALSVPLLSGQEALFSWDSVIRWTVPVL